VKLYFPRLQGKNLEDDGDLDTTLDQSDLSETVLVVEDDADLRVYLADVLRGLKYRVITCPNAQAAIEVLKANDRHIDLLLTDIVMPEKNGRELGHDAARLRPGLRILYMTGYSRNAVVHQGRLDEGVDLMQKPVSQLELASRVRMALDRRAK